MFTVYRIQGSGNREQGTRGRPMIKRTGRPRRGQITASPFRRPDRAPFRQVAPRGRLGSTFIHSSPWGCRYKAGVASRFAPGRSMIGTAGALFCMDSPAGVPSPLPAAFPAYHTKNRAASANVALLINRFILLLPASPSAARNRRCRRSFSGCSWSSHAP